MPFDRVQMYNFKERRDRRLYSLFFFLPCFTFLSSQFIAELNFCNILELFLLLFFYVMVSQINFKYPLLFDQFYLL